MSLQPQRIQSVDQFRGFAIISMILVNFLAYYEQVPEFLKHANGFGFTFADLVAPLFLFAVGLVSQNAVIRSIKKSGIIYGYLRIIRRNVLLIMIGIAGGMVVSAQLKISWGILQAIGVAGLIALPMTLTRPWFKILFAVSICLVYSFFSNDVEPFIRQGKHGGVQGGVMWSLIVILAEVFSLNLSDKPPLRLVRNVIIASVTLIAVSLPFSMHIFFSKSALTPSYILFSCGLSSLVFVAFVLLNDIKGIVVPYLSPMGRNALLLFLLHYALIKAFTRVLPADSFLTIIAGVLGILTISTVVAVVLDNRRWYFKL